MLDLNPLKPWAYGLAALAIVGALATSHITAYNMGYDACEAQKLKDEKSQAQFKTDLRILIAEEVAKAPVKHETIIQPTTKIIRTETRYTECRHTERVFNNLKSLLSGGAGSDGQGAVPAGSE